MTAQELSVEIDVHTQDFIYHVRAAASAALNGANLAHERSITRAAEHASILTALKALLIEKG